MNMLARVFPIKSKAALVAFAKAIDEKSSAEKAAFFARFSGTVRECWFYQEIDGRPHVVSVTESSSPLEPGFDAYGKAKDPFTEWFRKEAKALTGFDLLEAPKGPPSELVYELKPR
jgi:hypothetical protein